MDKVAFQQGWQVINITPEVRLVFLRHAVDSKVNVAALVVVSSGARAKEKDFSMGTSLGGSFYFFGVTSFESSKV